MSNTEQSRVEFESWVQSKYCTPSSQTKRKVMFEVWQERDNEIAALRDERNELKYETGRLAHKCNRLSTELVSIRRELERSNTECLGFATNGVYEWPIRDELIGNITKTLMTDRKESK